jgi:hypothetical protein
LRECFEDETLAVGGAGDVGLDWDEALSVGLWRGGAAQGGGFGGGIDIARVVDGDGTSGGRKLDGDATAQAATSAGDEDDGNGEIWHNSEFSENIVYV